MTDKEREELDKMLQDAATDWMGMCNNKTRTEANRQILCLKDIAIIRMMVNVVLGETDDPNIQLYIVDAIMKIVWQLLEVSGFDSALRNIVLGNFLRGTKFESRQSDLAMFRITRNAELFGKNKEGEKEDGKH